MRPIAALAALFFASMLVLAACGGSDSDSDDGAGEGSDTVPATTQAAREASTVDAGGGTQEQAPAAAEETVTDAPAADGRRAQDGDSVTVHYRGTLDDGEVFDSSLDRGAPLPFVLGSGQLISGFDDAVRGLAVGESITVRLEPDRAYGEVDPALLLVFPRDQVPADLKVGDRVQLSTGPAATVIEVTATTLTVDGNHELAGKTLTFEIELISIE